MAADMKQTIAQAAKSLLMDKGAKRLTVKDIVEECQITRQAFYYHFEDIPDLFRWMLRQDTERTLLEVKNLNGGEERLRYLFAMAINSPALHEEGHEEQLSGRIGTVFDAVYPAPL